jgi:hypothetical protein
MAYLVLWLGACAASSTAPSFPELRFTAEPPFRLDVERIVIEDRYRAPLQPPNVEYDFPVPLPVAARQWAEDRFQAAGRAGLARIIIEDASATLVPLVTDKGLVGRFTKQQAEGLLGRIAVRIEVTGRAPEPGGSADGHASASHTLPEGTTPDDRQRVYYEFTRELTQKFDREMSRTIRERLRPLLR